MDKDIMKPMNAKSLIPALALWLEVPNNRST